MSAAGASAVAGAPAALIRTLTHPDRPQGPRMRRRRGRPRPLGAPLAPPSARPPWRRLRRHRRRRRTRSTRAHRAVPPLEAGGPRGPHAARRTRAGGDPGPARLQRSAHPSPGPPYPHGPAPREGGRAGGGAPLVRLPRPSRPPGAGAAQGRQRGDPHPERRSGLLGAAHPHRATPATPTTRPSTRRTRGATTAAEAIAEAMAAEAMAVATVAAATAAGGGSD